MLEVAPPPRPASATLARLAGLDASRGLIMVLMALDHASFFVARVHQNEIWYKALPVSDDALRFLTRFMTHLCAPGFFLLMGVGTAFFAASREKTGWSPGRITGTLALRGLILVGLQFLVENPAWTIAYSGTLNFTPYYGVLYGLGTTLLFWSVLVRLPTAAMLAMSLAAVAATQILVPLLGNADGSQTAWLGHLLIPGAAGDDFILYPPIPWIGVTGLGICLGRLLRKDPDLARTWLLNGGLLTLAAFGACRAAGIGDFHIPPFTNWMMVLSVTKYPPSTDYLLLTLGVAAVLLRLFMDAGNRPGFWLARLAVFGRTPLFFYLVHLYVYALMGQALPRPVPLAAMYPFWLAGLALLYPPCLWYGRFKGNRPPNSPWRLF